MSPWSSLWTTSATNGAAIPALDADIVWKGLLKQSSWFCMVFVSIRSRHDHAYCTNRRMGKDTLKEILTLSSVDRVRILSNRHTERIPEILKELQAGRKTWRFPKVPLGTRSAWEDSSKRQIMSSILRLSSHRFPVRTDWLPIAVMISGGRRLLSCYISVRVS